MSMQIVSVIFLIWQYVSISESSSGQFIKHIKEIVYNCIKFWIEIPVLQFDEVRVALSDQLIVI